MMAVNSNKGDGKEEGDGNSDSGKSDGNGNESGGDEECSGNGNKESNGIGIEAGGQATATRVAGDEEGMGGKGNDDGYKSVGQVTATKSLMAMVTRVVGRQWQ
jgi:hypothetical protein